MGTKNNPGDLDCYANADPDEPMFVLLGRDPDAPVLVESWATSREHIEEDPAVVANARQCAADMRAWLGQLGKSERKANYGPGELEIGINYGQVVINLPRDLTGYIGFTPEEARDLAHILLGQADKAEKMAGEAIDR